MTDTPPPPIVPPSAAPTTPTADDVRLMVRAQNVRTAALLIPLLVLVVGVVWYAASTNAGARDSFQSTDVLLANAPRSQCITERRNVQADALGRLTIAANNAEAAGLLDGDEAEVVRQRKLYDAAVEEWGIATESLGPGVLDLPPEEGGCGPPILTREDIPPED